MSVNAVAGRLAEVRERIDAATARAGRPPGAVELVAVTKTVAVPLILEALEAGQRALGENRAQELVAKAAELAGEPGGGPVWHFVGRLQSNKVKLLAPHVSRWHSVDRAGLVEVLARHAPGASVYVEVNVAHEPQKGGCAPGEAPALIDALRSAGMHVEGLMTVPPAGDDPRPHFAALRDLGGRLGLSGLSMGMTGDFEAAIEEGATVVRVGSAIFGPRRSAPDLRR